MAPLQDSPTQNDHTLDEITVTADNTHDPSLSHTHLFAAVEESIISCRPLVNFFHHPNNKHLNGIDDEKDDIRDPSTKRRDHREAIGSIVKSPKFNKSRARRLFAGMIPLLKKITEEESYCPTEEQEEQQQEHDNPTKTDVESATQSILYLRYCAYLVEAYLEGITQRTCSKKSKRQSSNTSEQNNPQPLGPQQTIIDEAYEVAEILHSLLFPLQSCGIKKEASQAQSSIFSMCETYWHGNFEDREQMVTQLLPLLLVRSLDDEKAQKNDVKRLYSIRDAIDLLDFDDVESISSLKLHLLRTVSSPLFLQCGEGKKFISHLFQVHPSLVMDLHQAVKAQIPGAKRSILKAFAEIYFNAWKGSMEKSAISTTSEEMQTSIEENALQDFMHAVIHVANPYTAKSIRAVLDQFYTKKKSPPVESMLFRMYGPLLWRSLSAANARVRIQASVVLVDTFPLRDPHSSIAGGSSGMEWTTELCVQKSVAALSSLMGDDVPSVRVAGSMATAKILASFWVAIPSKDIHSLLNHIIAKHASDTTSSLVRATAVNAIMILLEEDKTHAVLRHLLPSLGNLIHDKTEKVRLAVIRLLLVVKKIRGMKYYHVVPAHHLLARLEEEGCGRNSNPTGPVAMGLTELLSNSFFPVGNMNNKKKKATTMNDIINRTLRLLTDNPGAALTFYRNASSQLSVGSISKLIAALMKCLVMLIEDEKKRTNNNCEDSASSLQEVIPDDESREYRDANANIFQESNVALMATIAESISILWESIESDLGHTQNESAEEMLMDVFSGNVLTEVYGHFESKFVGSGGDFEETKLGDCFRACVAILNCAGKMEEASIEGLRSRILNDLASSNEMPMEKRSNMNFSPNVALLCAWGMTEDVACCLASSITQHFESGNHGQNTEYTQESEVSKKRKQRTKKIIDNSSTKSMPKLNIDVCLNILGHILKGSFPASVSARESILKSETAYRTIEHALQKAQHAAEKILRPRIAAEPEASIDMIRNIGISLECYGRLLIHKEAMKEEIPMGLPSEARSLISWITNSIVPSLVKLADQDNALRDLDLSIISGTGSICSPLASGPPKRKMIRNSSPINCRLSDSTFASQEASFNVYQERSKFDSTRAAAITTISSVLCIFAEWLSVRYVGDAILSDQVSKWCHVLKCSDKAVKKALLPVFFRVSLVCLKNGRDSTLFNEVLLCIKNIDLNSAEEVMITMFMSTLLSLRDNAIFNDVIASIIRVTSSVFKTSADEDKAFLDKVGVCMKTFLTAIFQESRSSLILAQYLTDRPEAGVDPGCINTSVRTHLFRELKNCSQKTDKMEKLIARWAEETSARESSFSDS